MQFPHTGTHLFPHTLAAPHTPTQVGTDRQNDVLSMHTDAHTLSIHLLKCFLCCLVFPQPLIDTAGWHRQAGGRCVQAVCAQSEAVWARRGGLDETGGPTGAVFVVSWCFVGCWVMMRVCMCVCCVEDTALAQASLWSTSSDMPHSFSACSKTHSLFSHPSHTPTGPGVDQAAC